MMKYVALVVLMLLLLLPTLVWAGGSMHHNTFNNVETDSESTAIGVGEVNVGTTDNPGRIIMPPITINLPAQPRLHPMSYRMRNVTKMFGVFPWDQYDGKTLIADTVVVKWDENCFDKINLHELRKVVLREGHKLVGKWGYDRLRYEIWWIPRNMGGGSGGGAQGVDASGGFGSLVAGIFSFGFAGPRDQFQIHFIKLNGMQYHKK